jgi:hypothetical protein
MSICDSISRTMQEPSILLRKVDRCSKGLYLEGFVLSPLRSTERHTVRALLTHSDYDPVHMWRARQANW